MDIARESRPRLAVQLATPLDRGKDLETMGRATSVDLDGVSPSSQFGFLAAFGCDAFTI